MSDNMLIIVEGLHGDIAKLRAALATSQADVTALRESRAEYARKVNELELDAFNLASERDEARSDVTRLVAELAESVRALAVSRAENETTLRQHGDLCGEIEELRRALAVSQGEVAGLREWAETAKSLVRLWANEQVDEGPPPITPAEAELIRWILAEDGDPRLAMLGIDYKAWAAAIREKCRLAMAALSPPTPTAIPEPDRASPEVTVKEPR